ncbi:uncharacterized protein BDR25DRAFT_207453, partial [Lindgomyces ingoldianus]
DNAPIHRSKTARKYMDAHLIQCLDWRAQSPVLNPIKNVWRLMKLRISKRREYIHTRDQMVQILREE